MKLKEYDFEDLNMLFLELVPGEGKADTVAGEMVRAVERIVYRYFNDGDLPGVMYGESVNSSVRYLNNWCYRQIGYDCSKLRKAVKEIWEFGEVAEQEKLEYGTPMPADQKEDYIMCLKILSRSLVDFIQAYPKLKTIPNQIDSLVDYYVDSFEYVDSE